MQEYWPHYDVQVVGRFAGWGASSIVSTDKRSIQTPGQRPEHNNWWRGIRSED